MTVDRSVNNAPTAVVTNVPQVVAAPQPSPSASSPPSVEAVLFDQNVTDALDLVMAKRLASDTLAPGYVIITVGVLAACPVNGVTALGEADLHCSEFTGFTFATWFSAAMKILRLEDNTINNGVAGLWREVIGAAQPADPAEGTGSYYQNMILFEEYQLLIALAAVFPAPAPPATTWLLANRTTDAVDLEVATPAPFSLVVRGNQVEVRPQTQSAGASAAMMLALYREQLVQPHNSVIIAANRLCGGMGGVVSYDAYDVAIPVPAALVTLPRLMPCSITGNIVINQSDATTGEDRVAPSLWLTVAQSGDGSDQLAVTGNVLQGVSDLARIRRRGLRDETWSIFNANPS